MKKYLFLGLFVLAGVAVYLVFFKTEVTPTSLMQEAVATVEAYQGDGDAEKAIETLTELAGKLSELKANGGYRENEGDSEALATADRIRGELANVSMELEISDKAEDQKVSEALNKFMNQ